MDGNEGHRQQGVRATPPARKKGYPPNQLLGTQVGHIALVTYSDEQGNAHENMVFFVGERAYMDAKGGERWLREQLGVCQGWLGEALMAAYRRQLPHLATQASGVEGEEDGESEVPPPAVDVVPATKTVDEKSTKARLVSALSRGAG